MTSPIPSEIRRSHKVDVRIEGTSAFACRCASRSAEEKRALLGISSPDKNTKRTIRKRRMWIIIHVSRITVTPGTRTNRIPICMYMYLRFVPRNFARISPCLDPNAHSREVEVMLGSRYREPATRRRCTRYFRDWIRYRAWATGRATLFRSLFHGAAGRRGKLCVCRPKETHQSPQSLPISLYSTRWFNNDNSKGQNNHLINDDISIAFVREKCPF